MSVVLFDTLKLADKLQAGGFTPKQAHTASSALADAFQDQVATKSDIADLKISVRVELAETKSEILKWVIVTIGFQSLAIMGAVFLIVKFVK
jgi:hypothetical protein